MRSAYNDYFENSISIITDALKSVDKARFEKLLDECEHTIKSGHKIVASGLGKNGPICEKFVGTMLSLGMDACFLHINSAVHGDMGMIKPGDLLVILTKSGETSEAVYFYERVKSRSGVTLWLLSFSENSTLANMMDRKLIVDLKHEGDMWNIVPNNSTVLNLIILQTIAIELSKRLKLELKKDFAPNHPGGAIGARLANEE